MAKHRQFGRLQHDIRAPVHRSPPEPRGAVQRIPHCLRVSLGDEQTAALKERFAELEIQLHSAGGFMLADKGFHVAVARATGNELTAALVGALMVLTWKLQLIPVQVYPHSMPHHQAIKEAILAGDRDAAARAMAAHHDQIWTDLVNAGAAR